MAFNGFSDTVSAGEGWVESPADGEGGGRNASKTITARGAADLGLWRAEPGVYGNPGSATGETFVVLEGRARIRIEGGDTTALEPGVIISMGPNTPSSIEVDETLLKVVTNFG